MSTAVVAGTVSPALLLPGRAVGGRGSRSFRRVSDPVRAHRLPAARRPVGERATGPVRLTTRGRRVVTALLVVLATAVPVVGRLAVPSAGTPVADRPVPAAATTVLVAPRHQVESSEAAAVARGVVAAPTGWAVVTVAPGDSLWSIARRSTPSADVRVVVDRIVRRNGLIGTAVAAGDVLLVPTP